MDVIVPFDAANPNTRLAPRFDETERGALAMAMCRDVLAAVRGAGGEPTVVATEPVELDAPVTVDDRPLSTAVNAALERATDPVAVVMADLALATPAALARVFDTDGQVVFVPGLGGGTNVVLTRHPEFRVDYHGVSIRDHRERARSLGVDPVAVDSFRLSTDIDEPSDLVEVLLHTDGAAADWLRKAGVELAVTDGRVTVRRD